MADLVAGLVVSRVHGDRQARHSGQVVVTVPTAVRGQAAQTPQEGHRHGLRRKAIHQSAGAAAAASAAASHPSRH